MEIKPVAWMNKENQNVIYNNDGFDINFQSKFEPLFAFKEINNLKHKLEEAQKDAEFQYQLYIETVSEYDSLKENMKWLMDKCMMINFSDEEKGFLNIIKNSVE